LSDKRRKRQRCASKTTTLGTLGVLILLVHFRDDL